jgi:hypothetical protein
VHAGSLHGESRVDARQVQTGVGGCVSGVRARGCGRGTTDRMHGAGARARGKGQMGSRQGGKGVWAQEAVGRHVARKNVQFTAYSMWAGQSPALSLTYFII